jgi:uncharacterized protein (TIGR04255 family)
MDTKLMLPEYAKPPVVEVALSVQFEELSKLLTPQLGLLWAEFRDRFARTEEQPPIPSQIEHFNKGVPQGNLASLQLLDKPETPRCWFLNQPGDELVQVQKDRFVVNWRKIGDDDQYPRYSQLKNRFISEFGLFQKFVEREGLGTLQINQCEVTYVNHIVPGEGWTRPGELHKISSLWNSNVNQSFLPEPEEMGFSVRYVIPNDQGNPVGRLHVSLQPAYRRKDNKPIFMLTLIARGKEVGTDIESALAFFERGHIWIVQGFTSITTEPMHGIWGRQDAR